MATHGDSSCAACSEAQTARQQLDATCRPIAFVHASASTVGDSRSWRVSDSLDEEFALYSLTGTVSITLNLVGKM